MTTETKILDLRVFGFGLFLILLLGAFKFPNWQLPFAIVSLLPLGFAFFKPNALRPIYKFWMFIFNPVGKVISFLILLLLYLLMFVPVGLFLRVLRKDIMEKKIKKETLTYWKKRENDPTSMRLQF